MKPTFDSIGLFIKQVKQHAELLTELLSNGFDQQKVVDLMEKCIVGTNMLAGSTLVMGFEGWQDCLSAFEVLLSRYRNLSLPWDERIAQVVSELIEKEELLVSAHEGGEICDLSSIVSQEEIRALLEGVNVLLDSELPENVELGEKLPDYGKNPSGEQVTENISSIESSPIDMETEINVTNMDVRHSEFQEEMPSGSPTRDGDTGPIVQGRKWLAGTTTSLKDSTEVLFKWLDEELQGTEEERDATFQKIRRQLCLVNFFTRSMDEMIMWQVGGQIAPVKSSLEPVQIALDDFTKSLCNGEERQIDAVFKGIKNQLDAGLLFYVEQILRWMISDIYQRCEENGLMVEIEVKEENGALNWKVRDNGENFITDSRLDREEFLAFYPSLRNVRMALKHLNSVLWVEPDENHNTRFAFKTPLSIERENFRIWGEGEKRFSVLATQFCSEMAKDAVSIESDSRGEFLVIDERRVPLIKLEMVYFDAPGEGDKIAVIGSLEKRFAFYVNGDGRVEEGLWLKDAVSMWKGIPHGVAQLSGQRIPIIEAENLLERYQDVSGDTEEDRISGGAVKDDRTLSQSQATFEKGSPPPPEVNSEQGVADILVVERSDAVREVLESSLARANFNISIVESVEDALDFIRGHTPRLIISEFRMPSMAAKKIVMRLKEEGKDIPVLVTTSHSGANAKLLVEKLGVSGFLSKPLDTDSVFLKVRDHFSEDIPAGEPG